jgi:hypothetical protein
MSIALKCRAGERPEGRFSTAGGDNRLALILARLSFWANVERAQGCAAEAAYALHESAAVVSPVSIRSAIAPASNGSQMLPLPMEQNLAGARGLRQMPRYLILRLRDNLIALCCGHRGSRQRASQVRRPAVVDLSDLEPIASDSFRRACCGRRGFEKGNTKATGS